MEQSGPKSSDKPQPEGEKYTAAIHNARTEVETLAIQDMLTEQGISVMIRRFWDSAYDGVFTGTRGWGNICVFVEDKERAADLVARYLASCGSEGGR